MRIPIIIRKVMGYILGIIMVLIQFAVTGFTEQMVMVHIGRSIMALIQGIRGFTWGIIMGFIQGAVIRFIKQMVMVHIE